MPPKREREKIYLEFSFTQEERDNVLRYCSLEWNLARRFRQIVPAGSDIIVVFDKTEANEMMNALTYAVKEISGNTSLKKNLWIFIRGSRKNTIVYSLANFRGEMSSNVSSKRY